jgi:hypothetical protein
MMLPTSRSSASLALVVVAAATALFGASGCRVVGGIFRAGVWVGVLVIAFLAIVVLAVSRLVTRG